MPRDRQYFEQAAAENRLRVLAQPIVSFSRQSPFLKRYEILTEIMDAAEPSQSVSADEWIGAIALHPHNMRQLDFNSVTRALEQAGDAQFWINVSPLSLQDIDWLNSAVCAITSSKLQASQIVFEVTEHAPIADILPACQTLRELGCGLALDDFGAGYASSRKLVELPLTAFKIDQVLCRAAIANSKAYQVLEAFIGMARTMNLELVAEGIETREQLELLRHLGVQLFQGYALGIPRALSETPVRSHLAWPWSGCIPATTAHSGL